jgi:hypothetical protein
VCSFTKIFWHLASKKKKKNFLKKKKMTDKVTKIPKKMPGWLPQILENVMDGSKMSSGTLRKTLASRWDGLYSEHLSAWEEQKQEKEAAKAAKGEDEDGEPSPKRQKTEKQAAKQITNALDKVNQNAEFLSDETIQQVASHLPPQIVQAIQETQKSTQNPVVLKQLKQLDALYKKHQKTMDVPTLHQTGEEMYETAKKAFV